MSDDWISAEVLHENTTFFLLLLYFIFLQQFIHRDETFTCARACVCVHAHTVRSKGPSLQLRTGFISSTVNYMNKCGLDDELEFKLSENVVKINLSFEKDFEREI